VTSQRLGLLARQSLSGIERVRHAEELDGDDDDHRGRFDRARADRCDVRRLMVIVVMCVRGSGKTTVGSALAAAVGGRFADADDFHPAANIEKMRAGRSLTEADRLPWLDALRSAIDGWLAETGVTVLACS